MFSIPITRLKWIIFPLLVLGLISNLNQAINPLKELRLLQGIPYCIPYNPLYVNSTFNHQYVSTEITVTRKKWKCYLVPPFWQVKQGFGVLYQQYYGYMLPSNYEIIQMLDMGYGFRSNHTKIFPFQLVVNNSITLIRP